MYTEQSRWNTSIAFLVKTGGGFSQQYPAEASPDSLALSHFSQHDLDCCREERLVILVNYPSLPGPLSVDPWLP